MSTTTTTSSTVVPDSRAVERGTAAAQSSSGGAQVVATRRRTKGSPPALGKVDVTAAEVTSALGTIESQVRKATESLAALMPVGLASKVKVNGKGPSVVPFITGMAGIQLKYGDKLGALPTDPKNMQDMADVVGTVREVVPALFGLATALTNLGNLCLTMGFREAGYIYRQARVLAEHNQEVSDALAPYVNALSKSAKKGAASRRQKAKAADKQQPAPAPAAAPSTTTSTTVTSG